LALRPDRSNDPAAKKVALEEARQDVFLREVDEAVRKDQVALAARRYGKIALAVIVLGLAGLGGYLFWQSQQHAKAEAESVELTLAMDRLEGNQPDQALAKARPLTGSQFAGVRVPAQLLEAGIAQGRGETVKAVKLYTAIAADEDAAQPMRDLATLRLVLLQFDTMKPEDVIAKLKPMAEPGHAFFPSAAELVAMAYVEQGKENLAGPLFAEIARDKNAPDALRARARQIAGLMGTDAIDDVKEVVDQIERNSAARQAALQQAAQQAGQ